MTDNPLYIAFVWHMHQPFYKDTLTGQTSMPWVRLHAVKDYLDMALLLRDFPKLHQTFNIVPSLFEQLEGILEAGSDKDKAFKVTLKRPKDLTDDEKVFLLKNFFMANWDMMVKPFPRYYDLLIKRGKHFSADEASGVVKRFTDRDYADLQLFFNLAWIDPRFREKDAQLNALEKKGKYFSEDDKKLVLDKQIEIIGRIVSTYRQMQDEGTIEVSVSPFYHPILPLLCDTDIAKVSYPEIKLPRSTFRHSEDAKLQIESAVKFYTERFGRPPRGMWPSEGSVSEQAADLMIEAGITWAATDEEILFKSLDKHRSQELLYRPYILERRYGGLTMVFRDRALSDSIGFVYQGWPAENAAADLINRLHSIREKLPKSKTPYLIPIILDGENAWEFYPDDGRDFLTYLYKSLSEDPQLKVVTVSEYINEYPPQLKLDKLYPGSWINANFCIWIGHEEKNKAWEYLGEAREVLKDFEKQNPDPGLLGKAWKELYIAEGSDWNWWYGDDNSSANDEEFDRLFRTHLSNVYRAIGKTPPEYLSLPIKTKKARIIRDPTGLIRPTIDGRDSNYFEWINAGLIDASKRGGTMHQSDTFIKQIYFGFDAETLYLRFDVSQNSENGLAEELSLNILFVDKNMKASVPLSEKKQKIEYVISEKGAGGGWMESKRADTAAFDRILEISLRFDDIRASQCETLNVMTEIAHGVSVLERCPEYGAIHITLPGKDYESQLWTA